MFLKTAYIGKNALLFNDLKWLVVGAVCLQFAQLARSLEQMATRRVSRNAAAGASTGDSLAEPRALAYASRTAYVSHA